MVKGLGTDIIEIARIEAVNKNDRLAARILSEKEYKRYDGFKSDNRKLEYLAGRFAGKEAYSKAHGTGIGELNFKHIEILNDESGKPYINGEHALISISHCEDYATATVIILEKDDI